MKKGILAVIVCVCLLVPAVASAENLARDYIPAPPGTVASILYWNHITSNAAYADGKKVAGVDYTGNVGIYRGVYWFMLGPFEVAPNFLVPFGNQSLSNPDDSASGVGNPILLATIWFLNRPSSKSYLGFSPYFFLPLGQYNRNGLSMADNRWTFREEANFTQGFEVLPNHTAYFEVTASGDFYTSNNDFGPTGTSQTKNPLFNLESHLSYDLTKDWWISADFYGRWGGSVSFDQFNNISKTNTQALGGTLAYNLGPGWQILLQYRGDVAVENGLLTQTFLARLLYATDLSKFCK
jgi:hypothetical protein